MIAVLYDRLGIEVYRKPMKAPLPEVLVWAESAYVRFPGREDPAKPHEKYFLERRTHVIPDTPASGVYRRSDLYGS